MYETQIFEILKKDKIVQKTFCGIFARDELPKSLVYPACFVLNTQPRSMPGEHWLAFYFDKKGNCDFFDSYGSNPSKFGLTDYLDSTTNSWSYNKKRIQGNSDYCGHYCILYLLFRSRNKEIDFYVNFDQKFTKNDQKITKILNTF